MSHNKIKVGGQSPNTSGEISVDLNNLNDVNITSIANDEVLQYDTTSSEWKNQSVSSVSTLSYILIGQGESDNYSNSTTDTTITASHALRLYDSSPMEFITGASLVNEGATDWIKQITLPAGEYLFWLTYRVKFSASGVLGYAIEDTSGNKLSSVAYIGDSLGIYEGTPSILQSVLILSSSTTVEIRPQVTTNVDTVANQLTTPSEFSSIYIEKLS